jgi:hypothetical protein
MRLTCVTLYTDPSRYLRRLPEAILPRRGLGGELVERGLS